MYFFEKQFMNRPDTNTVIQQYAQEADYEYARKFQRAERRQQSLLGRCLIRKLAIRFKPDTNAADWQIMARKNLPPQLSHPKLDTTPYVNVSHSHELVAVNLASVSLIGVDVEFMAKSRDIHQIVEAITAEDNKLSLPADKTKLYAIWCLYESWYKMNPVNHNPPIPMQIIDWINSAKLDYRAIKAELKIDNMTMQATITIEPHLDYVITETIEL
ncbi:4'-phosphopantetheinyl transferase family protein [Curvivirga sp.]|uniref:4'-phosphopantetheinyl transferase family protein n=1 Tax=Curvivirga sp. TaxID=2856848 RepID=UPI003B5A0DCB